MPCPGPHSYQAAGPGWKPGVEGWPSPACSKRALISFFSGASGKGRQLGFQMLLSWGNLSVGGAAPGLPSQGLPERPSGILAGGGCSLWLLGGALKFSSPETSSSKELPQLGCRQVERVGKAVSAAWHAALAVRPRGPSTLCHLSAFSPSVLTLSTVGPSPLSPVQAPQPPYLGSRSFSCLDCAFELQRAEVSWGV